ncbi:MAG: hypothetical protein HGA45_38075 [Chloroflexales bacterium]|nr:hypothetical protein [Chloroflexales bacterium]
MQLWVRQPQRRDLLISSGLALVTTGYAIVLEHVRQHLEPDWAWAEVVLGTVMCLGAAELRVASTTAPTADDYRRAIWTSFVIGGTPIILWQFWQLSQRYHRVIAEWKKDNDADSALSLA